MDSKLNPKLNSDKIKSAFSELSKDSVDFYHGSTIKIIDFESHDFVTFTPLSFYR